MIHAGDAVLIGPDSLGQFQTTHIRSIERKRIPVPVCAAGQSASFALKRIRRKEVRKGMVVLPKLDTPPKVYREFVAEGITPPQPTEPSLNRSSVNPQSRNYYQDQIPGNAACRSDIPDLCHH